MNAISIIRTAAACGAAALLLSACGGPVSDTLPAPATATSQQPPASASASTQGLVAYTAELAASRAEGADAIDLGAYTLPADASDAAQAVATPNDSPRN